MSNSAVLSFALTSTKKITLTLCTSCHKINMTTYIMYLT